MLFLALPDQRLRDGDMAYQLIPGGVLRVSDGAQIPESILQKDWIEYLAWLKEGNAPQPAQEYSTPTQFEIDRLRYKKRADAQSDLIAWMAADNMSRVRSGVWTVADLTSLMSDPAVTAAQAYMGTLSYELAAQSIMQATHPLLTPEIKGAWVGKLQEHFYLVP